MTTQTKPPNPFDPTFSYENDKSIFLFTSLTAGSSHIVSATARMETILKANRITYYAIDCATDEKARRIWTRRGAGKRLPGLVREGMVLGDLEKVEEWNEFGEIKMKLGGAPLPKKVIPARPGPASTAKKENAPPTSAAKAVPAPMAPPMPPAGPEPSQPKDTQAKPPQEPAKPERPGQASLASEVAAAALKRKQEKAAALKAKYSSKDNATKQTELDKTQEGEAHDNSSNKDAVAEDAKPQTSQSQSVDTSTETESEKAASGQTVPIATPTKDGAAEESLKTDKASEPGSSENCLVTSSPAEKSQFNTHHDAGPHEEKSDADHGGSSEKASASTKASHVDPDTTTSRQSASLGHDGPEGSLHPASVKQPGETKVELPEESSSSSVAPSMDRENPRGEEHDHSTSTPAANKDPPNVQETVVEPESAEHEAAHNIEAVKSDGETSLTPNETSPASVKQNAEEASALSKD